MNSLIITLFGGTLAACGGGSDGANASTSQLLAGATTAVACYTPWNGATAYNGGGQASYNNVNYTANWRVGRDCGFFREKLTKLLITWKEIVNRHNSLSPVDTIASH